MFEQNITNITFKTEAKAVCKIAYCDSTYCVYIQVFLTYCFVITEISDVLDNFFSRLLQSMEVADFKYYWFTLDFSL